VEVSIKTSTAVAFENSGLHPKSSQIALPVASFLRLQQRRYIFSILLLMLFPKGFAAKTPERICQAI